LDCPVIIPRGTVPSLVFLRSRVPAKHPSAAILGEERLGCGVAVGAQRVLTAHYLVLGADDVAVVGVDGKKRPASRIALDHESGLALLSLDGPELRPAALGEGVVVRPGLPVFMLTCTSASERKGATGHVTSVGPFEAFWEYMLDRAIMTTAINPGLAGAPLFDNEGRLIGLVSLGLTAVARYSLAIPLELYLTARDVLEDEAAAAARPQRAWIGFYPQAVDGGVVVTGVVPGGPADEAGLKRGDLMLSVDGQPVATLRELYREVWRKAPGDSVGFKLLRDSEIRVVEVRAGDRRAFYK
jgi:S1-C subfamily serine protease